MPQSDKKRGKRVLILVACGPFNTLQASEAFRMGVGLTLAENQTTFLLIHDGVFNLLPLRGGKIGCPSLYDFIGVFEQVGLKLCADADSMLVRKMENSPEITQQLPSLEVMQMIREADVVIPLR